MALIFILIMLPFASLIANLIEKVIHFLIKNKEVIIMLQEKIIERKNETTLDDIMEEVKLYDAIVEPVPDVPAEKKEIGMPSHEPIEDEVKLRNGLLKGAATIGLLGLAAWWNLISPLLYVPAIVIALCTMSYKFGEWKGETK